MKKALLGIVLVCVVAAVGATVYFSTIAKKQGIEDILPQDALFYARMTNIEENLKKFSSTALWENISQIDIDTLLAKSGLTDEQIEQYDNFKMYLSSTMVNLMLKKFFGEEVAIVAYPDLFSFDMGPLDQIKSLENLSNIFVITRLKPEAQFADFIAKVFNLMDQTFTISSRDYKEHTISVVKLDGAALENLSVAYVKINDLVVFGIGENSVRRIIDVISGDSGPMSEDTNFKAASGRFVEDPQMIAYGNLELVFEGMLDIFIKLASLQSSVAEYTETQMKDAFKEVAGFMTFGFSFGSDTSHEISQHKYNIVYDVNQMDRYMRTVYSCPPAANNSLEFVPEDVISYQWSNCFDFNNVWESIKEELENIPEGEEPVPVGQIIAGMEGFLNLSFEEDVLPAFGDEIGGFLSDIDVDGIFPLPKLLFFVEIENQPIVKKLMEALTDQPYVLMQSEEYGGVNINYVALPFGVDLQPGYCFLGDYFLLSTNRQLLKDSVTAYNDQAATLVSNQDFKDINFGLTDPNNSIAFLQNDKLMSKLQSISSWVFNWMTLKVKQDQAFQVGTKQRLSDLKADLNSQEEEISRLKSEMGSVEEAIAQKKNQREDYSGEQFQADRYKLQLEAAEKNLAASQEKVTELESTVQGLQKPSLDPEVVRLYLDEVVYPVLKGLESYSTIGSKVKWGKSLLESTVYLKIEN